MEDTTRESIPIDGEVDGEKGEVGDSIKIEVEAKADLNFTEDDPNDLIYENKLLYDELKWKYARLSKKVKTLQQRIELLEARL